MNQKGISSIVIILIIVGILVVGGGIYWYFQKSGGEFCIQVITPAKNPLTGECKEFSTPCNVPVGWKKVASCSAQDETTNWQTYRNEKFGIELKYPADVLTVQGDDRYSKTIMLIDKRFAGQNVDLATVPNYFSIDLAKDNSIDSLVEGERVFFSAPKSQTTILRTEEVTIDGTRAVKVVTGDKSTMIEKGLFIVTELPRTVSISSQTYNLVSFGGKSETLGFIDKIVGSIKFLK